MLGKFSEQPRVWAPLPQCPEILLIHVSLVMRTLLGKGTPRSWQRKLVSLHDLGTLLS